MPTGIPLTDDAVHRAVWTATDRRGVVKLDQTALAAAFGVTKFTMSRKINALLKAGRLRQLSNKGNARGRFQVVDPDTYEQPPAQEPEWFEEV